jgi:dipeptidyl aminopeptidase/acylaminoacyl peptidase
MLDHLLDRVSWTSHRSVRGAIRAVVVRFPGLGSTGMRDAADPTELELGDRGILTVWAWQDPWGWMNAQTRDLYDDVVTAVRARLRIASEVPLIASGGSMGGHAALAYAFTSRLRVHACQANCPVCDLPFHYGERPDLPRTMHHAFRSYDDISAALREHSPLHQADRLPDIPYQIIHGVKDQAVGKAKHSDALVDTMRRRGLRIEYIEAPDMAHCGPVTYEQHRRMIDFVFEHAS